MKSSRAQDTELSAVPRPTLLVAEPEPGQALSVRKLVLETGKFNVLTAHSSREALDLYHLFPNVSAAVLVGESGIDCEGLASRLRDYSGRLPIIYLHARIGEHCTSADHRISSQEPEKLLDLMRSILGDPRRIK